MMRLCEKGNAIRPERSGGIALLVLGIVAAMTVNAAARSRFVPNEIIVKFRTSTLQTDDSAASLDAIDARPDMAASVLFPGDRFQGRKMSRLVHGRGLRHADRWRGRSVGHGPTVDLDRIYRIEVDVEAGEDVEKVLAAYLSRDDVEYAELNPVIAICASPDDPSYNAQWSLAKIQAAQAWDTCRGGSEVVVAIIDTGVDYDHRDLQGNLWMNEAERNGEPDVDDDKNGYVDDIHGYNFIDDTNDPMDDHGHGTHCAGIVAAVGNNGLDIAGVCWNAKIMPIKILDANGEGDAADAVPAIYYAVANGADIISGSWGGEEGSDALKQAIAYAHRQGVLVVTAAGNLNSSVAYYPAAYPEVLSVAATDTSDRRWYLSNYGNWVDLAAPGYNIVSLRRGVSLSASSTSLTTRMSGTSMAAPHVSGACALLLSANPSLTCDELHDIVMSTGDSITAGIAGSNRRLNVYAALQGAVPPAGTVHLDREKYADGTSVSVLVADWDLRNAESQGVFLTTDDGDEEVVTLAETEVSLGVFRGEIVVLNAVVMPGDGVLQTQDGQGILVRYQDADDGLGNFGQWRQATAQADFVAPMLLDVQVQVRGTAVTINLLTDEPALAEIHYGTTSGGPYGLSEGETQRTELHGIDLSDLRMQTRYYFVVSLTDAAGNEILVDDGGQPYSFMTSGRPKSQRSFTRRW
jgi:subtilisin family serine protease